MQNYPQQQQQQQNGPPNVPYHRDRNMVFDGKRMRKAISRKYVDVNSTIINYTHNRVYGFDEYLPPHSAYSLSLLPPSAMVSNPASSITTHFAHASTNKVRCPINVVVWTPEGRRLLTGASTGEFTLWNGMAFNFETIQQAHSYPVRSMVWSHNDTFMATADNGGVIKYWQSNMNNLKEFQGHEECIRDLSFCPSDVKFASCSDDGTVKIWDFETCQSENTLSGHGSDVKCCDWHPSNSLIASGSKDYLIKLWDARSTANVATLHGHKNVIFNIKWNNNGNWLLSCSKDQLIKMYDIRYMKDLYTFKGHTKEVTCLAWHPFQEDLFASGAYDGSIFYWIVGSENPQAKVPNAHDSAVWDLAWHPLGHILCSGSNDHTAKFWVRNRQGDNMRDKYNISQLPADAQIAEPKNMTDTKKSIAVPMGGTRQEQSYSQESIPGFGDDEDEDSYSNYPPQRSNHSNYGTNESRDSGREPNNARRDNVYSRGNNNNSSNNKPPQQPKQNPYSMSQTNRELTPIEQMQQRMQQEEQRQRMHLQQHRQMHQMQQQQQNRPPMNFNPQQIPPPGFQMPGGPFMPGMMPPPGMMPQNFQPGMLPPHLQGAKQQPPNRYQNQ